jgi:hypothetical protein
VRAALIARLRVGLLPHLLMWAVGSGGA